MALRLTIWYTCSAFALVLIATGILYWALVVNLDRQDDQFLIDEVHILRDLLAERPEYADAIRQEVEWESAARRYARVFVRLLDRDGSIVAETPGMSDVLVPNRFPPAVAATDVTLGVDTMTSDGTPYRLLAARTNTATTDGPTTIQIAVDRIQHRALLAQSRKTLFAVLLLVLAISSLAAHVIARRGIQPIVEVTATARRIRSTTLHERIEEAHFPAELAELAETFNEMLDRLQESFDRLSRFSADIAHELRTPVNNLRGEAEVTLGKARSPDEYRESLGSCLEESLRLVRIIDGLLLMARSETPEVELQREPLDLAVELAALREFYEAPSTEAGIHLQVKVKPGLQIHASRP
ncbi:MAG: HAMP domain-containing protein, partial [Planctomycetales bacterium]|nr:HAMP domain-containing protein [Planctomycetales bacterium]